ncbi:hypothetical protein PGB90_006000 [Kerria lacca]
MNPGYPPYPSQQTNMPTGQYPVYPPTTTSQSSISMPSPYPNQVGFSSNYPPQPTNYSSQCNYPPQSGYAPQACYPQQTSTYPQQISAYPQQTSTYPQQTAAYPPQLNYPPTPSQSGYPPNSYTSTSPYPTQAPANFGNQSYSQQQYSQQYPAPSYSSHSISGSIQQEKPVPTVVPVFPFDPRTDAEILRKAMKGFGTDENAIINVLTKRSNRQRSEIAIHFKSMYGKDLISDLKSELSGKFEELIIAMMIPLPEYLASEIHHAIEGFGTNEETLVEILCTASNSEINTIKEAYQRFYGNSMERDLCGDTSGHFRRLMISLVQGRRSENYVVDESAAMRDAQALMAAGVLMIGTDESTFNSILCTRSYPQLRRVFMEYQRISGKTLEQAIKSEFSGDIETGLLAIVRSVEDKSAFFADRIRVAVACVGTKDRQLIRIIVTRSEIDMQNIKKSYQQRYGKSIEQDISEDTSGYYKKTLLALVSGY